MLYLISFTTMNLFESQSKCSVRTESLKQLNELLRSNRYERKFVTARNPEVFTEKLFWILMASNIIFPARKGMLKMVFETVKDSDDFKNGRILCCICQVAECCADPLECKFCIPFIAITGEPWIHYFTESHYVTTTDANGEKIVLEKSVYNNPDGTLLPYVEIKPCRYGALCRNVKCKFSHVSTKIYQTPSITHYTPNTQSHDYVPLLPVPNYALLQSIQPMQPMQQYEQLQSMQPMQQYEQLQSMQPMQQYEQLQSMQPMQQYEQLRSMQPMQQYEQMQSVQQYVPVQPVKHESIHQLPQVQPQYTKPICKFGASCRNGSNCRFVHQTVGK